MMALRSSVRDAGLVGTTITGARRELGEQLATLRGAAGHKQTELAGLTGYSRSSIANAEVGRQPMPREFWVRADDLLGGQGALVESHDKITLALGRLRGQGARETAGEREIRYGLAFGPACCDSCATRPSFPPGGKVSKISLTELADLRRAAGPSLVAVARLGPRHPGKRHAWSNRCGRRGAERAPDAVPPSRPWRLCRQAVNATRSASSAADGLGSLDQRTAAALRGPGHR